MQAGRLRHRVKHLKKTVIKDAYGDKIENWAVHKTLWCAVESDNDKFEKYRDQAIVSSDIKQFTFRKNQSISLSDSLEHDGKRYDIIGVENDSRKSTVVFARWNFNQ